jgi:hypothetical protein
MAVLANAQKCRRDKHEQLVGCRRRRCGAALSGRSGCGPAASAKEAHERERNDTAGIRQMHGIVLSLGPLDKRDTTQPSDWCDHVQQHAPLPADRTDGMRANATCSIKMTPLGHVLEPCWRLDMCVRSGRRNAPVNAAKRRANRTRDRSRPMATDDRGGHRPIAPTRTAYGRARTRQHFARCARRCRGVDPSSARPMTRRLSERSGGVCADSDHHSGFDTNPFFVVRSVAGAIATICTRTMIRAVFDNDETSS